MVKIFGYIILGISCFMFIMIPVIPWFDFTKKQIAGITAVLLVAGEILFYVSVAILGRTIFNRIKNTLKFWRTNSGNPEQPAQSDQK
jgi:hypothetical protein